MAAPMAAAEVRDGRVVRRRIGSNFILGVLWRHRWLRTGFGDSVVGVGVVTVWGGVV